MPPPGKCSLGTVSQLWSRAKRYWIERKPPPQSKLKGRRAHSTGLTSMGQVNTSPSRSCRKEKILGSKPSTLRPGCPVFPLFLSGKPEAHGWLNRRGSRDPAPSLCLSHALSSPQVPRAVYRLQAALGPNRQGASTAQELGAASCRCQGDHSASTTAAAETQTLYSRLIVLCLPFSTTYLR